MDVRTWRLGGEVAPRGNDLRNSEVGSFEEIAKSKSYHMAVNGLEDAMDEFLDALEAMKPLCIRNRSLLFGDTARSMVETSEEDQERLYDGILSAYDEAIDQL